MSYASPADLNAYAAVAEGYDEIAFHTADPGADPAAFLAAGGGPYALPMGTAAAAGPSGAQPATDGRTYSSTVSVTITEPGGASWVSVRSGGVVRRTFRRARGPLGPGTFPIVYGLAVRNQS